ncbi:MAG: DEAD/DEAH box helicase, partial [Candidatus Thermoplasmatota archaeon]|nr:DEAD/DEAH box helicase [Candidatus Thermoplasmatota archaeon]
MMEVGSQARVRTLGINRRLADAVEDVLGIDSLYPPQEEALKQGLTGRNLMLSIPTASGKSLVAHICMLQKVISSGGGRGIYVVPLKALASEKHEEIRGLCEGVGLRASLALGDRGEEMGSLHDWDVLVCTSERLDSLIRTRPNFLDNVEAIVVDEFHLLDDPGRGPTLEIIIARIRHERPGCQIIALSATVGNSDSVSNWLKADLVKSEWRPVELQSGTVNGLDLKIHRIDGMIERDLPSPREIVGNPNQNLRALVLDAMETGGQTLIFVNSRASAQKEARELSKHIKRISEREGNEDIQSQIENWEGISKSIAGASEGTTMSKALAESVSRGVGFHHAGLSSRQRRIIEDSFRMGNLAALVATPTLAQGVNLPSR